MKYMFLVCAASLIGIRTKLRLMHHYFECMQTQEQKVVRQTLVFVENLLGNEPAPSASRAEGDASCPAFRDACS